MYKADALLLSDLPTPSFVLDVRALRKRHGIPSSIVPSLRLPGHGVVLRPCGPDVNTERELDSPITTTTYDLDLTDKVDEAALAYLHASVVASRDAVDDETFLAELDLPPSFCGSDGSDGARLVLGLNNHHVGSYYWARSAGAGSSMDAIGVQFRNFPSDDGKCSDRGVLCWENEGGYITSNSNDGKRSEWCNFLRPSDTVQLVPTGSSGELALLTFLERLGCIYGVSAEGRPMGSEPKVVCRWVESNSP